MHFSGYILLLLLLYYYSAFTLGAHTCHFREVRIVENTKLLVDLRIYNIKYDFLKMKNADEGFRTLARSKPYSIIILLQRLV